MQNWTNPSGWGPDEDGEGDDDDEDDDDSAGVWDVEDGEDVDDDDEDDGDADDEKQTPLLKWDDANLIATSFTTSFQHDYHILWWCINALQW